MRVLSSHRVLSLVALGAWACAPCQGRAIAETPPRERVVREPFDVDPRWDAYRNRLLPEKRPVVVQNFGFSPSKHAGGKTPGEIGGVVSRSTVWAAYARSIPTCSLDKPLSISGRFAVTRADSGSGVMIGWFHESSRGWRTPNSLAMRIDGNGGRYWLFYEYGTSGRQTGGGGAFEGPRYQTTATRPFAADGASHEWLLRYEPRQDGTGLVRFAVDGREWDAIPVPKEHRAEGARFNRFGIWNVQIAGESMSVFFDDLTIDGAREDFPIDPKWIGYGNVARFEQPVIRPFHDFGFNRTALAGGRAGEIGGVIFRDEKPAYYGRPIELLTLDDSFEASGRIALQEGAADSGVYLGWFDADSKRKNEIAEQQLRQPNVLALLIEGPSRVGHYIRPVYMTSRREGDGLDPESEGRKPPVIHPDSKSHRWSIRYAPKADGTGLVTVRFDGQEQLLAISAAHRRQNARFDRFGLFNLQRGGHHVRVAVDDLSLVAAGR